MGPLSRAFNLENVVTPYSSLFAVLGTALGAIVEYLYGSGRGIFLVLLVLLIIGDWVTGIAAAKKHNVYNSDYGIRIGLLRTAFLLLFPAIGNWFDKAFFHPFEINGVMFYVFTSGLIYHTWESMTANAYRAGWKKFIPKKIVEFVSSEIKAKNERALEQANKHKGGK